MGMNLFIYQVEQVLSCYLTAFVYSLKQDFLQKKMLKIAMVQLIYIHNYNYPSRGSPKSNILRQMYIQKKNSKKFLTLKEETLALRLQIINLHSGITDSFVTKMSCNNLRKPFD